MLSFIPGGERLDALAARLEPNEPAYNYTVWLRHLTAARRSRLTTSYRTVVEIGPGRSLGRGICALLTGASRYYAWDIVRYASPEENERTLDGLVELFRQAREAPDEILPDLGRLSPQAALDDAQLNAVLDPDRVEAVRAAVRQLGVDHGGLRVDYTNTPKDLDEPADFVFSQAVMEHVVELDAEHRAVAAVLKPGGVASHHIDFKSHHFARDWNGHWAYSDAAWRVMVGHRKYAINRAPLHEHVDSMERAGLRTVGILRGRRHSNLTLDDLHPRFVVMPPDDLDTHTALVQAVKR